MFQKHEDQKMKCFEKSRFWWRFWNIVRILSALLLCPVTNVTFKIWNASELWHFWNIVWTLNPFVLCPVTFKENCCIQMKICQVHEDIEFTMKKPSKSSMNTEFRVAAHCLRRFAISIKSAKLFLCFGTSTVLELGRRILEWEWK